jgi:hypothetical protein
MRKFFTLKLKYVLLLLALGFLNQATHAQLSLTNTNSSATINFSATTPVGVGTNSGTAFAGAGFSPDPTSATTGRLNSNAWAINGWSDGGVAGMLFGGTQVTTNTDFTRGTTAVAVSTGGMYAYTGSPASATNPMLLIQPGGSDFAPGTLTLRIKNNGTTNITQLIVSYNLFVRNDQLRSNSFNFSYSADNSTYTPVAALDYTSTAASDALGLVAVGATKSTTITGLNIAPGAFYYIRWSSADVGGSGSRDEFGLDDISVAASYAVSTDATLSALSVSAGVFTSSFTSTGFSYTVNAPNSISTTTVTPTANDPLLSTIKVNGNAVASGNSSASIPLTVGVNLISVLVTAQNLSTKTYTVTINRSAPLVPVITLSSPLAAFGSICTNTTTAAGSFTLSGNDLDGSNISIAAPTGFICAESITGTYTGTLNFSPGTSFSGKIIYVKFNPTAVQSYDGNILVSGGTAPTIQVPVSGSGINTLASVTTVSNLVNGTAATLSGSITANGCTTVSTFGFEYSTVSGFANGAGITVTASGLNGGGFSKTVTGFAAGTTYYFKAFATNNGGTAYGTQQTFTTSNVTPVVMNAQPLLRYAENFNDITNWTNNFISGIGANRFSGVIAGGSGSIPNPVVTTATTASFASGTSGGVQKGTGNIVLLSTGSTDNSTSAAIDFYMDFTGVNAGTLSFDWASVNNSTGNRNGSMHVYATTDAVNFTELVSANVINFTNNIPSTGTVNSIALPASFNNSPTARLRFYYNNGTGGVTSIANPTVTGSRPKISIDNLTVTAVASANCTTPTAGPTSLSFGTITETSIQGSFVAASPAVNEYVVVMSTNSSLTSLPLNKQTYFVGDNIGDGTVISKGSSLNFTATGLTGATTYYFFVFPVNSVCTNGPLYLTDNPLSDDATTVAGLPACTSPAGQATNLVTTAAINSIQGSFMATAADEYLVLQSASASFTGTLVNGTAYGAGTVIGNATVIQKSNSNSFTASGLTPATQYYYYIFSINSQGCVNGPVYNSVSPLSGSQTTLSLPVCATPAAQPSSISFNASNNSVTATFNGAGSGYNYLVIRSSSPTLSGTPLDNTDYPAGSSLGGGTVISNNTSTSFIASSLNSATTYYFFVFSANSNCAGGTKYLVSSPLSDIATTTNAPVNNIYFGNLHAHSDYSDGNKDHPGFTPGDDYNFAQNSLGMDFLGISEHNHFSSLDNPGNELANYHLGVAQASAFNTTHPNFLALYGMEWGVISGGGHVVVYGDGLTDLFGWESNVNGKIGPNYDVYVPKSTYTGPDGLFKTVNDYIAKNAFATLAHPNNTDFNNLSNVSYDAAADSAISGVAVESGPATSTNITYSNPASPMFYLWYYQKLLSKGYHLGPTIDHDNHNTTFGRTTTSRTAVIAPALTQSDIIKAIKDMHYYATEDIDAKVDFTINTRIMGSVFEDRNAPSISVNLTDASTPTNNALIRVMFGIPGSGTNAVVVDSVFGSSLSYVDNNLANHATGYYYIDITNGSSRIITSPIWYTRTCASSSDTTATVCGSFNWYGTVYTTSTVASKVFTTVGGCDSTVTLHLTVNNSPASATIATVGSATGCPGAGVALTANAIDGGNGAISSYQWLNTGVPVTTTAVGTFTAFTSGNYSVKVINQNNCSVLSNEIAVTVVDNTAPVPNAASLQVITGECSATVTVIPTATDNCTGTVTGQTIDPLSYTQQGTFTITWTFNDGNGNNSSQTQTVIIKDITAPVLSGVPSGISVSCDNVPATVPISATDNCDASPFVTLSETSTQEADSQSPAHYNYTITRTWTATDVTGNSSVASQVITVADTQSPVITTPLAISQNNDAGLCSAVVTFTATATDNCSPVNISYSKAPGTVFPVGVTTVTVTATDVSGNTSSADFTVAVTDIEKPTITAPGAYSVPNDGGQCGATIANIGTPVTNDNCGVLSVTNNHPSTFYPVGTTIVTWTVTDIHGNVTDTAQQSITVMDNELPTIVVSNTSVNNTPGLCSATVILPIPVTHDNCGVAGVTNNHPSPIFPVGTTTVTWTVTDNNGLTKTALQTVTVIDTEKPTITAPDAYSVPNDAGQCSATIASIGTPVTNDNCGVASVTNNHPSPIFPVGTTTVTWTVTDNNGLTKTALQTVTVTDTEKPTITAPDAYSVPNDAGQCSATIASIGTPVTNDNCGVASVTNNHPSSIYPVGTTTVTWTVTDNNGLTKTALQTVTVTDTEKPVVITRPVTIYLNASGATSVTAAQVNNGSTDNCGISSYSLSKSLFSCSESGVNTVTLTVTDVNGNDKTGTALVTVKDTLAPVITVVPDQVFCNVSSGSYTIPVSTATDNCGSVSIAYAITGATARSGAGNNASGVFASGISTISWTATDASGNKKTGTTKVTVSALPAATITVSNADAFCNKITLTANTTATGGTYKWLSGSSPFATTQQISLGQTNSDGVYQVTITANGCTSAPAGYTFQKQNLVSSYTILATTEVELGENNTVASGSVGVTSSKGEASFGKNSSVSSAGSFVKAKYIDKNGPNITITNPIYSPAAGIVLPTMLLNTANTNNLPNKDVAQNSISTVNGNYKNLTLKKGSRTTLSGNAFGTIRVEQGAQVTFTATNISIDNLQVVKGPRNGYSYVRFTNDTKVLISNNVIIGSQVYINPDNNNVTFYMGDKKSDDERFTIKGGDTKVTANIYLPNGKLKVTGGYSYGDYGNGYGDCDRDDDDDRYYGKGNSYVYMTGLFIAEQIEGNGKNVIWNTFDCAATPVPVQYNAAGIITQANVVTKESAVTTEEELKVTVMPNPTTTYFTLKLESKYATPVNMRVMDGRGRVVDARSEIGSNSTLQIGQNYAGGTYYAEMIQGSRRKLVQLIKL